MSVTRTLEAADRRKRRAALLGLTGALLIWSAAFAALFWVKSVQPRRSAIEIATFLIQSLETGAPVIGFLIYLQLVKPRRIVLWLRRFREGYGKRIRFHGALSRASQGLASPTTLQDRSFRTSFLTGAIRAWAIWPLMLLIWLLGLLLVTVPSLSRSGPPADGVLITAVGGWTAIFVGAVWWFFRRMGYRSYRGEAGLTALERRLKGMSQGRRTPFGVEVLKCDDAIWRKAVTAALSTADIVVVDVTEPTDNVLWELGEALRIRGARQVVLALESDGGRVPALITQSIAGRLDPAVRSQLQGHGEPILLLYPARQAKMGRALNAQVADTIQALRTALADRIQTGESRITRAAKTA